MAGGMPFNKACLVARTNPMTYRKYKAEAEAPVVTLPPVGAGPSLAARLLKSDLAADDKLAILKVIGL